MAESAAAAAAGSVANLAIQEASFLCGVHDAVESLRQDWMSLQAFLSVSAETQRHGDAVAADSIRRVRDAAYEAENILDTADYMARRSSMLGVVSRYARKPMDLVARHRLGMAVLRWRKKVQGIKSIREFLDAVSVVGGHTTYGYRTRSSPHDMLPADRDAASSVVGLEGDVEQVEAWLKDCAATPQLTMVSIVAMGGAGKTTLARKVCISPTVKEHFDAFAFVSISQQFEALAVLKEITTQATGINKRDRELDQADHELERMGEQELAEMLHGFLATKRYLIVLDDVWRMNTWEVLQHAFPDPGNGSRVILTTRDLQVAKQADKLTRVHHIGLLNEPESWQLFSLKAFPSYTNIDASNRRQLESVGRNLAQKCHGLPLALVVLGSHLSKNHDFDVWSKMERSLDWEATSKWDNLQQIIALSYDDMLSRSLKDCFLYIASFPEDHVIGTDDLARHWIAEGFLQHRRPSNQTMEDAAYDCMEELVQRSMVHIVDRRDRLGRISTVQMHDVLREWAIRKAWEERFLKVCKSCDDLSSSSSGTPVAYRLSFLDCSLDRDLKCASNIRSLLGFHLPRITLGTQMLFIRVLYMADTNLERISGVVIGRLIHLRYIGLIRCRNVVLPSSIGKLLNLQSIDLTGTYIPHIPKSLWDIPTLWHVKIPKVEASLTPTSIRAEGQSELQTLHIGGEGRRSDQVSRGSSGWTCVEKYLMRMAQLRTLVLYTKTFLPVEVLTSLKELHHLQCLHLLVWESTDAFLDSDQLPQNLQVLALCFLGPWSSWHIDLLPTLGRLQNLLTLKLFVRQRDDDMEDRDEEEQLTSPNCHEVGVSSTYNKVAHVMCSPAGAFPRLRYLILKSVRASKLRFQAGTMPNLKELIFVLSHMTTVPDGLLDLPSLEKLVLHKLENVLPRETHELLESKGIRVINESK